jgi:lysozyme
VDSFTTDLVNQNQFDALVSFAYNLGSGALKSSTLLKKVNINPNDTTIQAEFEKWVYAGNVKLQGLIRRRKSEAFLYYKGQLKFNF